MWILYFSAGLLITLLAIVLLRRELNRSIRISARSAGGNADARIDELNEAFFDIANDLEGKYSVHDKQIADLEAQLQELKQEIKRRKPALDSKSNPPQSLVTELAEKAQMEAERTVPREIPTVPPIPKQPEISIYRHGPGSQRFQPTDTRRFSLGHTEERNQAKEIRIAHEARALLRSGSSIQIAAKRLGVGVGELKLILELYPHEAMESND
ncbi:MAG: hypothetical protein Q4A52_05425 [Bacillota bacterium]|nr:hypothetical protein [Bacillota bacterium]